MANTQSIAFPNLFNVAQNRVAVLDDDIAIANRVRLLMLTEPTEVYNEVDFGAGLRKYLFQYNNDNTVGRLQDNIVEQLRKYEPLVDADKTKFAEGLLYTGQDSDSSMQDCNNLKFTVMLETKYENSISVSIEDI